MKKIQMIIMLLVSFGSLMAQDVIVKKDGNTVVTKILEISTSEVLYQLWSNQKGPIYIISVNDISRINFSNGEVETFNTPQQTNQQAQQQTYQQVQQQQFGNNQSVYAINPQENIRQQNLDFLRREELMRASRTWNTVGVIVLIASWGGGYIIGATGKGHTIAGPTLALGIPGTLGAVYCWIEGASKRKEAYKLNVTHEKNRFISRKHTPYY